MKKAEPVMCKNFSMWNTSLSTLFNVSPKVTILCGNCKHGFSKRFDMKQLYYKKYPIITCPCCGTQNKIPVKLD